MRKTLTVAAAEFVTAVRARGFWIGILLMPVLFGGAVAMQQFVEKQVDARPRRVAIIDDTGALFAPLTVWSEAWNRGERDLGPRILNSPRFLLEQVVPGTRDRDAIRLELSERVRREELFAFAELPLGLLDPETTERIRYYSSTPAYGDLPNWIRQTVMKEVMRHRFEAAEVSPIVVARLVKPLRRWTACGRQAFPSAS